MNAKSDKPDINETGMRGFLKWLQREQPGVYARIAPQLPKIVPGAFSDYNSSLVTHMRRVSGRKSLERVGLMGFGDISTANVMNDATAYQSVDIAPDISALSTPPDINIDTSDAANTGQTSTPITDSVSGLITGAMQAYATKTQLDTAKQVTNLQLQRAQMGLPPLNIDMSKLGVPSVNVGISPGTQSLIMYGGLALLGVWLVSSAMKRK